VEVEGAMRLAQITGCQQGPKILRQDLLPRLVTWKVLVMEPLFQPICAP
jgi:hypothetical protein